MAPLLHRAAITMHSWLLRSYTYDLGTPVYFLWPPCVADADVIFMTALCNMAGHYYGRPMEGQTASTVHIRPLQNVLNATARLILCKRKYDRITAAIRDSLHWLPVRQRIDYINIVCARLQVPAPGSTCLFVRTVYSSCIFYWSEPSAFSGERMPRHQLQCRTKNYGQRSFSYSGPTPWNSLPLTLRDKSMSLSEFCSRLKTEMFRRGYNWS